MMDADIAERMRRVLEHLKMSQVELAESLGMSKGFVGDLCRGTKRPGVEFLQALTERHGVSASWVLTGRGPMQLAGRIHLESDGPPDEALEREIEERVRQAFRVSKAEADRRYIGRLFKADYDTYERIENLLLELMEYAPRNSHLHAKLEAYATSVRDDAVAQSDKRAAAKSA